MKLNLTKEFITLAQLLKELALVSSGGAAKEYLKSQKIYVNDMPENRRGKKLFSGDKIEILGEETVYLQQASKEELAEEERIKKMVKKMNENQKKERKKKTNKKQAPLFPGAKK